MWALLNPEGTCVAHDWEDLIIDVNKREVERIRKRMIELTGEKPDGLCCGWTAEQWKACRIEKVVLVRHATLPKAATRSR